MKLLKKIATLQFILYIILNNFSIVYADKFTDTYSYYLFRDTALQTGAQSVVVMDADTNVVMYAKNPEVMRYPASITKIMTALLLIEYVESGKAEYDDLIVFSEEAIMAVPFDGTNIGQQPGTSLTIDQALYSLMLPSANEIANGIGEYVGGSMDDFAKLMTKRAQELGCKGTQFTGASGLHDDNHYTTALDMALIMDKACEYEKFVEVAGTVSYSFERVNANNATVEVNLVNSNKLINSSTEYYNPYVLCGKTGFTSEATHTLVTYSEVNGHRIIISVLNATKGVPYTDTTFLLDYFKDKYHDVTVSEFSQYETLDVYDQKTEEVFEELTVKTSPVVVTVPNTVTSSSFETAVFETMDKIFAPIEENSVIGNCEFVLNSNFKIQSEVVSVTGVEEPKEGILSVILNILKFILLGLLYLIGICAMVIVAIRTYNGQKRKKRALERRLADDPRSRRQVNNGSRGRTRNRSRSRNRNYKSPEQENISNTRRIKVNSETSRINTLSDTGRINTNTGRININSNTGRINTNNNTGKINTINNNSDTIHRK